ncbi:MAG: biotin biosynthesis cytochrome P450 [marine bacterium B5-7]|nr:MAG: biotin biosynthesis cytochrome P450 [marine bacterium B5-7]
MTDNSIVEFDPFNETFIQNPYQYFDSLRSLGGFSFTGNGMGIASSYSDVRNLLEDRRFSVSPSPVSGLHERQASRYVCADVARQVLAFMDPPGHTALKQCLSSVYLQSLRSLSPDIQSRATELFARAIEKPRADLLREFATPLATAIISDIMGIPETDREQVRIWSRSFFRMFNLIPSIEVFRQMNADVGAFRSYMEKLLQTRRKNTLAKDSSVDVISQINCLCIENKEIDVSTAIASCMFLAAAGNVNVDSAIALAIRNLLLFPEKLEALRKEPELISNAADELLRFDTPTQIINRRATTTFEFKGKEIKRDTPVLLLIGSANRDPAKYMDPDVLHFGRPQTRNLTFGTGAHSCLGASLVKSQLSSAITALVSTTRPVMLTDEPQSFELRTGHRWLKSLDVNCG